MNPCRSPFLKSKGSPPRGSALLLFPFQGQQLGVGGEDLGYRLLELPGAFHPWAYSLDPLFRNPFHTLAALHHKR